MGSTAEARRVPPPAGAADEEARLKHEEDEQDIDEDHEHEQANGGKPRRKRRRAEFQTSDKKYECPDPGCGKKYSRAEHLYRHQLNRMLSPKPSRVTMLHLDISTQARLAGRRVLSLMVETHRHPQTDISM